MAIKRTTAGLASALFDELDALVSGKSTPQQAKAKASLASTILSISKLEMDYARFIADNRDKGTKKLPSFLIGG